MKAAFLCEKSGFFVSRSFHAVTTSNTAWNDRDTFLLTIRRHLESLTFFFP